jgi:hypothetical protein
MTKSPDVQVQQVLDAEFWVDQARRSIDGVTAIWKSSLDYGVEVASQWRKLTLEMLKK